MCQIIRHWTQCRPKVRHHPAQLGRGVLVSPGGVAGFPCLLLLSVDCFSQLGNSYRANCLIFQNQIKTISFPIQSPPGGGRPFYSGALAYSYSVVPWSLVAKNPYKIRTTLMRKPVYFNENPYKKGGRGASHSYSHSSRSTHTLRILKTVTKLVQNYDRNSFNPLDLCNSSRSERDSGPPSAVLLWRTGAFVVTTPPLQSKTR
jgi:hypothetical protein